MNIVLRKIWFVEFEEQLFLYRAFFLISSDFWVGEEST